MKTVCKAVIIVLHLFSNSVLPVPLGRTLNSDPSSTKSKNCAGRKPVFQRKPKNGNFMSVDLWLGACLSDIESLRSSPLFPLKPSDKAVVHSLSLLPAGTEYCHRITGYLMAPSSGVYLFHAVGAGSAEVWLSTDTRPVNSHRIITIFGDRQSSNRILLEAQQHYYFEIISCADGHDKLQVSWLPPGIKNYVEIDGKYMRPVSTHHYNTPSIKLEVPPLPLPDQPSPSPLHILPSPQGLLRCSDVTPSAAHVSEVESGSVYPADNTDIRNMKSLVLGNEIISHQVVQKLSQQIKQVYSDLDTISTLKMYPDGQIWAEGSNTGHQRTGTWLGYQHDQICDLRWAPSTSKSITMVVSMKGPLETQMKSLLKNLRDIQEHSDRFEVSLIIVDFNGGVATWKLVDSLQLQRVQIIPVDGDFDRGIAMSLAARSAPPNSLLFFIDLHVQIPRNIAESLWTHTIRGKTAFAPALIRLNPHGTPENPNGLWEMAGYGLLSVFREDFINSNCDKRTPTFEWGGEDHYFVNKLLENNFIILRRRLSGLYHFQHDRLWQR